MRSLTIAALSTLMLLCTPFLNPQGCRLHSIGWTPRLLWVLGAPAQISASERGAVPSAQESIWLETGKPVEGELSGGQSHSYKITAISGQYLHIVVEQRGIDVVVALFSPDGRKVCDVDGERATVGAETISAIAEAAGAYRIEARSPEKTAKTGRYEINIKELREATAEDKHRVAAESVFREAEQLRQGTPEERRKGIEKYQEALELYRRAGASRGEAETLNNIGAVHLSLGELRRALDKFNEALPIRRAIGDRRGEASTLHNIGSIHLSLGETLRALDKYNEALLIAQVISDRHREIYTLNQLGLAYQSLGETRRALEKFNEELLVVRAIGERRREAGALGNIARVYRSLGETQRALGKYKEALLVLRAIGDRQGEAAILNNFGLIYQSLGEMQRALENYSEALLIVRATATGNRHVEAAALGNIGVVYQSLGETRKALDNYNEARLLRRAMGDRQGEAFMLNQIGLVYQSLGETRKALDKYNEALSISQTTDARSVEGFILHNIGEAYNSSGDTQKALDKFNEALSIRRARGARNEEAVTLLSIAQLEQRRGNLIQARQFIEQAIGIIESMRANISGQELRASFFASRREFYQSYIDVLMQMHKQNPTAAFDAVALEVSERARARSLLELLTESQADIRQGVDSSLLERERSLRQLLNAKAAAQFALLNRRHTPAQAEAFAIEIAAIATEYEELREQIRARSPKYATLTQPQPLSLAEIQQQVLDPDTLLLEYSLGDNASYLFVVSQTSITWRQLPKRVEIEEATRRVRELLTAPQRQPGDTEANYQARVKQAGERYWLQAAELSQMLLGPVASQLGKKRLAIVADGALQYLPFAALPVPSSGSDEGRNSGAEPQPLFVEHEIVNLPSASTLATLRRETAGRKPAEKSLAVLADPVFEDDDTRVRQDVVEGRAKEKTRSADSDDMDIVSLQMSRSGRETGVIVAEGVFGRLVGTRREAAAILALVPERERLQALDFEASRATALRPGLGEYRIVHFATHGLLNNIHPELSGIVLSLVDEEGKPQDGFLRLQDVYNLKLPAELVVLSACQTGLGKEIRGEGLIGLTRGFMYAGASRVVASLWKVDDWATSELMKRFYQGMLGPAAQRPAGALRQAQLSIWKQKRWRAPYYWAAFVLQGEWK